MPYHIIERDSQYCVALEGEDTPIAGGCHATQADAEQHMQALYANVTDARMERVRLNLISEVALAASGAARPIHILRTGTFTDMLGRSFTFEPAHITQIVANFATGTRKRPPITERHDFGRAVGRIERVWSDATGTNLYAQPKWNRSGTQLLSDEVYDGFSCELDHLSTAPTLIGGSLTNYPAIDSLDPVSLEAPPFEDSDSNTETLRANALFAVPAPSSPALDDTTRQPTRSNHMDDLNGTGAAQADPTLPPDAPAAAVSQALAGMEEQLTARQMEMLQTRFTAMQEQANRNAEQLFLRWQADQEARARMTTWAQHATTATLDRRHALSCPADELVAILAETPAGPRAKWQALLDRTLTNGFVSFEEIGSEGGADERDDRAKYDAAVAAKVAAGMSRVAAIQAVARENPELYAAQAVKKGGR